MYEYLVDKENNPSSFYWRWAIDGWNNKRAERYPMGRGAKPLYSYWDGQKLDYVAARKNIYIPLYAKYIAKTPAFAKLKEIYETSDKDIYLLDFDAHNLEPDSFNYFDLVNNPNVKVGHAYVLAMMLENVLEY